jgi:hypothetical protein
VFIVPDGGGTASPRADAIDVKVCYAFPAVIELERRQPFIVDRCDTDFLFDLAHHRLFECLANLDVSSDDVPAIGIRLAMRSPPPKQQSLPVEEYGSHTLRYHALLLFPTPLRSKII